MAIARGSTGRSSWPFASCQSARPTVEPSVMSTSTPLSLAKSPMVATPMRCSFVSATGPMPQSLRTGRGSSSSCSRARGTTNTPSGFACPEAILAYCLPDPAPMEEVSPVSSRISRRNPSPHSRTSFSVAPMSSVGSMNASSTDSCSITPACRATSSNTRFDAALYTTIRGRTTTADSPISAFAWCMGVAERTPNARAS